MAKLAPQRKPGRRKPPAVDAAAPRAPMPAVINAARHWNAHDAAAAYPDVSTLERSDVETSEQQDDATFERPNVGTSRAGVIKNPGRLTKNGRKGARTLQRLNTYITPAHFRYLTAESKRRRLPLGDTISALLVEAGFIKVRPVVDGEVAPTSTPAAGEGAK